MPDGRSVWKLEEFLEHLDIWIRNEQPDQDLTNHVTAWVISRGDTPYVGVRREPGFGNLWYGQVPGSVHGVRVVTCSYWILERQGVVRCNSIATLSLPA